MSVKRCILSRGTIYQTAHCVTLNYKLPTKRFAKTAEWTATGVVSHRINTSSDGFRLHFWPIYVFLWFRATAAALVHLAPWSIPIIPLRLIVPLRSLEFRYGCKSSANIRKSASYLCAARLIFGFLILRLSPLVYFEKCKKTELLIWKDKQSARWSQRSNITGK